MGGNVKIRINAKKAFSWLVIGAALLAVAFGAYSSSRIWRKDGKERVVLETSEGRIEMELYEGEAPVTVENFLGYVESGHYDGTVFHRVIEGFMIQGGGFTPDGAKKETEEPIPLESDSGLSNERGTVAMARGMEPDSATSQFFINTADNDFLDYGVRDEGYAVFGRVVEGMEVVERIEERETTTKHGREDWPAEDVVIESAYVS